MQSQQHDNGATALMHTRVFLPLGMSCDTSLQVLSVLPLAAVHTLGNLLTNVSLGQVAVSFTHTIKASACCRQSTLAGKGPRCSKILSRAEPVVYNPFLKAPWPSQVDSFNLPRNDCIKV